MMTILYWCVGVGVGVCVDLCVCVCSGDGFAPGVCMRVDL